MSISDTASRSGWLEISVHAICLILPMIALTAGLAVYVLIYQIRPDTQGSPLLFQNNTTPEDHAFYVGADSTMLVFLASWMSSLAPLLTGSAIALTSYPVARQLLESTHSQSQSFQDPTPSEYQIMLKIINGSSWGGLWAWLRYAFGWKHGICHRSATLAFLVIVMASAMVLR